ncbi:uncharacterized protein OCT59_026224 [Rhizophagus irregularis]|uniref:uncharacterized protein n=1 Tax=Rhizophagus irregularis TaxID=588596 RepID=UPI00333029E8|nr:hypothetical protein OCT59_026224 [Rhizophagus irregularis]
MAGIPYSYFDWDDSIPDFLAQLRLDLQNQGIDPNDNAASPPTGRNNAIGHLKAVMRGRTLEWFDDEITTKQNWELTNLLDNTGQANLVANEDWHIAGGRPTNAPVNAPNANAGNTVVIADRRANYRPEELRRKFLDALPLLLLKKAEDIGEHLPLDELAKKLYEIELRRIARHKSDRTSDLLVSNQTSRQIYELSPVSASQQHGISFEDMQKAIQNALAQQKTEYQSLLEKQKADFQSQMV